LGVIDTKNWLKESRNPIELCEKLEKYFHHLQAEEIHHYLSQYGMLRTGYEHWLVKADDSNIWTKANNIFLKLKKRWNGPDVPIFIFPVEERKSFFGRDFKGRSGLSFQDKMFLFLSPDVKNDELIALLIHEYHHICRLRKNPKHEKDYTLLDAIILEGLAEHTVYRTIGEQHVTNWVKKYSKRQLYSWWKNLIVPNQDIKWDHPLFDQLLFGKGFYPTMLGYAIGFDIVQTFYKQKPFSTKESFYLPAEQFVESYETKE